MIKLNEAISMNTIGNMTFQLAAERKYIKKYIIYRFKKAGIKIDIKSSNQKRRSTYNDYDTDDIFNGFTIRTYDMRQVSSSDKLSKSKVDIEFKTRGNSILVKYGLYNEYINKKISINNLTCKSFMDQVLLDYKKNVDELEQRHLNTHKLKDGEEYLTNAIEKKLYKIADDFDYNGSSIIYDKRTKSFHLVIQFENHQEYDKLELARLLLKFYNDPTIKRYMDPEDKIGPNQGFGNTRTPVLYKNNYKYTKQVINKFVDYIDSRNDVHMVETRSHSGTLSVKVEYGPGPGIKPYIVKKRLIKLVQDTIKSFDYKLNIEIRKAPKYGKIIIKRFFRNPEKYIG